MHVSNNVTRRDRRPVDGGFSWSVFTYSELSFIEEVADVAPEMSSCVLLSSEMVLLTSLTFRRKLLVDTLLFFGVVLRRLVFDPFLRFEACDWSHLFIELLLSMFSNRNVISHRYLLFRMP